MASVNSQERSGSGTALEILTDRNSRSVQCEGRPIRILGEDNEFVLLGDCPELWISGSRNRVTVEVANRITLPGDDNVIGWMFVALGTEPRVSSDGRRNRVNRLQPVFASVAGGLTVSDQNGSSQWARLPFAAQEMPRKCDGILRATSLRISPDALELAAGESLHLDRIRVVAYDAAGRALAPTPVVVEAQEFDPPIFASRSDGRLDALRAGRLQLRVRTVCGDAPIAAILPIVIRPKLR